MPGRPPIEALTPQAQFVDPDHLLRDPAWHHDGGKLFLGMVGDQPIGARLDTHVMTVAGSRQGKGRNVIVPNLLLYEGSVLVTDPKAELANVTAAGGPRGSASGSACSIPSASPRHESHPIASDGTPWLPSIPTIPAASTPPI